MALEAMQRNGHNLGLGVFECEGLYDTPKLASCADFDTKRKIKRQSENWVHFSFGWVQNAQR